MLIPFSIYFYLYNLKPKFILGFPAVVSKAMNPWFLIKLNLSFRHQIREMDFSLSIQHVRRKLIIHHSTIPTYRLRPKCSNVSPSSQHHMQADLAIPWLRDAWITHSALRLHLIITLRSLITAPYQSFISSFTDPF